MNPGTYKVIQGDITEPVFDGQSIVIPHIVNNVGGWGAGVTVGISRRWPRAEQDYRNLWRSYALGHVLLTSVAPTVSMAQMFAQDGIATSFNRALDPQRPPIRYGHLADCMKQVRDIAVETDCDIHCPMFGAGLAGGDWKVIEQMMWELWCDYGINVKVYEWKR